MRLRNEKVVFLFGSPRSGTSWIAKIFNSHPGVLYRHEPDTVLRNAKLPNLCSQEDVGQYREQAREYLLELLDVRTLKSAGLLPLFPKTYRSWPAEKVHNSVIYALHFADLISRGNSWVRKIAIPDFVGDAEPLVVMKSVGAGGRAKLFANALPGSRMIYILRHPCGQVASMVRGIRAGKLKPIKEYDAILESEEAREIFGASRKAFRALSPIEEWAWHWAIVNQKALNDLDSVERSHVHILRYEDACAEPERIAKELLAFAGLDWNPQTEAFLRDSTMDDGAEGYFDTKRDPMQAANRWRERLTRREQEQILNIVGHVPAGQMFLEGLARAG